MGKPLDVGLINHSPMVSTIDITLKSNFRE